jgi:hypothetical protein
MECRWIGRGNIMGLTAKFSGYVLYTIYIYIYIHKGITNDKCVVSLLKFILARGAVPAISDKS